MPQTLHDSGERRTFKSGAVRDRGDLKPRPDLISPHAQMREGMIMTLGGIKYELRNWERGLPISECLASAQRHIEQYKRGDTDEDHMAQARWNLGVILHFEEEIKAGRMDPAIDDMPHYAGQEQPWLAWTEAEKPFPTPKGIYEDNVKEYDSDRPCANQVDPHIEVIPDHIRDTDQAAVLTAALNATFPRAVDNTDQLVVQTEADTIPEGKRIVHVPQEEPTRTFYIVGPMRGIEDFNFPAFDRARDRGLRLGFKIISPADMDREAGINETTPDITNPAEIRKIVHRDLQAIAHRLRAENGDGLALLPGWRHSTGGTAEVLLGRWLGLKFVSAETFRPKDMQAYWRAIG